MDVDGSGHGVYLLGKNPCAFDIATNYLVAGTMPEKDPTCGSVPADGWESRGSGHRPGVQPRRPKHCR